MEVPTKSRYETAKALEGLHKEIVPGAVRFTAGGFAVGRVKDSAGLKKTCIRFFLHEGKAIEVALPPALAASLGQDILCKGGAR